jgi:hypothetical protein
MDRPEQRGTQLWLQRLPKFGWLGRLLRFSDGETGGGEVSGNGNGSDPAPEDTLEFDAVSLLENASAVTVSALSMLIPFDLDALGDPLPLTEAQERARKKDIDAVIAASHAQPPSDGKFPFFKSEQN